MQQDAFLPRLETLGPNLRMKLPLLLLLSLLAVLKGRKVTVPAEGREELYTVAIPIMHLGWVGFNFKYSTLLLGQ